MYWMKAENTVETRSKIVKQIIVNDLWKSKFEF
jgi:hypothetical protein